MSSKAIPQEVRKAVEQMVMDFNDEVIRDPSCYYIARYRGRYLYLDRSDYGRIGSICRLKYNGQMNNWGFAIFKYSSERYDPDEWFFPGSQHVDGTVAGAMKAGLEAYR